MAGEDIVRLILDGTVVRVRLDRKATNLSLLVALGMRRDGQKVTGARPSRGEKVERARCGAATVRKARFQNDLHSGWMFLLA